MHINQIIRERKIGIIALQETHLTQDDAKALETLFPRMHIISLLDPQYTNTKEVALVINKDLVNTKDIVTKDIIPG